MKFQPERLESQYFVQRYDENGIVISGQLVKESVVFGATSAPKTWDTPQGIDLHACTWLAENCPAKIDVLLVGTGQRQVFPSVEIRKLFVQRGIPVEYMDTPAACRTYNILIGEGRQAFAALLWDTSE